MESNESRSPKRKMSLAERNARQMERIDRRKAERAKESNQNIGRTIMLIAGGVLLAIAGTYALSKGKNDANDIAQTAAPKAQPQHPMEFPVIEPTGPFGVKVLGSTGPIIYILGWDHDGGPRLEKSKVQLNTIIEKANGGEVNMVIEGFYPPGKEVKLDPKIHSGIRSLLYDAASKGVKLWAGEKEKLLFNAVKVKKIKDRKALSDHIPMDEQCLILYSFEMANIHRTSALLKASLAKKRAAKDSMVIGCMGDGHFEVHEQKRLREFAEANGVRLVLYATKKTLYTDPAPTWPEKFCGPWEEAKKENREQLQKLLRSERIK
jgi:hypothetical protein